MRYRFMLPLALCATSTAALAQTDDVVVMRRVVTKAVIHTEHSTAPSDQAGTWTPGEWRWTGTNTCQEKAPQVRDVQCKAFGKVVADSRCKEEKPSTTGEQDRLEGCTYRWIPGQYSDYSPRCSAEGTQTRSVDCQRIETLKTVDAAYCPGATKPDTSKTDLVTASCRWDPSAWTTPAECGKVKQTRTVSCQDVDTKTPAGLALCGAAVSSIGAKPAESQDAYNYDSCSYTWQVTGYAGWKTACSATARRDKIFTCMRSDGTVAPNQSSCTSPKPVEEDVGVSPCTDAVKNPSFETEGGSWTGAFTYMYETQSSKYERPSYYGAQPLTGTKLARFGDGSRYGQHGPTQTIPVVAGTKYQVSAWGLIPSSNNPICANDVVKVSVVNGSETVSSTGGKYSTYAMQKITTPTFTAKSSTVTIMIDAVSTCNTGSNGVADDVSLSIVP